MTHDDPRTDWRRSAFWLDRLAVALLIVALRAADLVVLLIRPHLLLAYLRLRLGDIGASPYATADSATAANDDAPGPLTYAETPVVTALWLFRRSGVCRGACVVDLGAGRGVPLLAARFLGAQARGVELLEDHVRHAAGAMGWAGIELRQGNATQETLDDATHILLAWMCYSPPVRAAIEARLNGLRSGTVVIAIGVMPAAAHLRLVEQVRVPVSWGWAAAWICRVERADAAEEES